MKVNSNYQVGPGLYRMDIISPEITEQSKPGQFVHIKVNNRFSYDPLLRRPFSIHDIEPGKGLFSIIYKVVGRGTEILSRYSAGESIDVLGPLGKGFYTKFNGRDIVLIGGGMGIAPLIYLLKHLRKDNNVIVIIGARNKEHLNFFEDIFAINKVKLYTATLDGSGGFKGTVIDVLKEKRICGDYVYACGPEGMLVEVQKYGIKEGIAGEFSLEARMGCGTGLCLSCVIKTRRGNKRVCKDGPVFSLEEVVFDG